MSNLGIHTVGLVHLNEVTALQDKGYGLLTWNGLGVYSQKQKKCKNYNKAHCNGTAGLDGTCYWQKVDNGKSGCQACPTTTNCACPCYCQNTAKVCSPPSKPNCAKGKTSDCYNTITT